MSSIMPNCKECNAEISDLAYMHCYKRCLTCCYQYEKKFALLFTFISICWFLLSYGEFLSNGFLSFWDRWLFLGIIWLGVSCAFFFKSYKHKKLSEKKSNNTSST